MKAPSKSPITLPFGATSDPYTVTNFHKGTDFSYIPDNQIYAPFSGKVTLVPNNGNDGNGIYMTEPNGNFHGMLHSSKYLVANGSNVTEGQPIAVMGETGYAFGVHLHWCVKVNGVFIDPMTLIKEDDMPTLTTAGNLEDLTLLATGRSSSGDPNLKNLIGQDLEETIRYFLKLPEHLALLDRAAASTTNATVLKPGEYKVQ